MPLVNSFVSIPTNNYPREFFYSSVGFFHCELLEQTHGQGLEALSK